MTTNGLLDAALDLAARGWPVFPLAEGGKRPAIKQWETRATTDPDRIERCWRAGAWNIGLATGPAGLLVIDLDRPKPGQQRYNPDGSIYTGAVGYDALAAEAGGETGFGETFTVRTPSGGWHLYFARPDDLAARNTASKLAYLVDTRAGGGYVVAPGSATDTGTYDTVNGGEPAPLPAWLADRLTPADRPAPAAARTVPAPARLARRERRSARLAAYLAAAINRETTAVATTAEGGRNHRLYCAAVALGQLAASGYLTDTEAAEPLTAAARAAGLTELETARTITSGLTAGAKNPRVFDLD
ncbi:bifunctional DNA primase/polymerase [Glycomyces sp. MUSA5-2]|uniref:bifunctional DNA primase/polymerase n=1 Tax=Glycomyces sp. MUSA5-2 TaxID=2053002 RepID=UPI00300BE126